MDNSINQVNESLSVEIWKDIRGFEGHYQVSNFGSVRSVKSENRVLKADTQRNGYKRVYLWKDGRKYNRLLHRLVAEAFIENPCAFPDVNHKDEDKHNNRADNLEWCSHQYNMNYGTVREKISKSKQGHTLSRHHKELLSKDTSLRRWINNGVVERYVYLTQLEQFVSNGWNRGRIKRSA